MWYNIFLKRKELDMLIVGSIEAKAREISSAIQEYLEKEELTGTDLEDVMDFLIEKGIFEKAKKKKQKTLDFENVLNQLTHMDREKLIVGMRKEVTKKKTVWYFDKV